MTFVGPPVRSVPFRGDQGRPVEFRGVLLGCPAASGAGSRARAAVDGEAALEAKAGEGFAAGITVGTAAREALGALLFGVRGLGLVAEDSVRAVGEQVCVSVVHQGLLDDADVFVALAECDVDQGHGPHGPGRGRAGPRAAPDHHPEGRGTFLEGESGHCGRGKDGLEPLEGLQSGPAGEHQGRCVVRRGGGFRLQDGVGLLPGKTVARQVDSTQP